MKSEFIHGTPPHFYGSTTIGERGQIVIPAEARKDLGLNHSTKVMVFKGPAGYGLLIVTADSIAEMISKAGQMLDGVQGIIDSQNSDANEQNQ